jgi:hypothetical protein
MKWIIGAGILLMLALIGVLALMQDQQQPQQTQGVQSTTDDNALRNFKLN